MSKNKRPRASTVDDKKKKKSKQNYPVTRFEHLANELIYEIFDYLDVHDLHQSFFSLNARLRHLCLHANLSLRIGMASSSKTTFERYFDDIIVHHQHQIRSLYLYNPFVIDYFTLSQCSQLETLALGNIGWERLEILLTTLVSVSSVLSLSMCIGDGRVQTTIYSLIFQFPALKYCKLNFQTNSPLNSLSVSTNSTSPIERLIIIDNYSFDDINMILPYVPKLRYLFNDSARILLIGNRWSLGNVEAFVRQHSNRIRVLDVTPVAGVNDLQTWEKSILSHIPYVSTVNFTHDKSIACRLTDELYQYIRDRSFMITSETKQYFFTHEPMSEVSLHEIVSSCPLNKHKDFRIDSKFATTTFECHDKVDTDSIRHLLINDLTKVHQCTRYFSKTTELTIDDKNTTDKSHIIKDLPRILSLSQLTNLSMRQIDQEFEIFIKLLRLSPNVHTIKWVSIEKTPKNITSLEKRQNFQLLSKQNQVKTIIITHDYTKKMMEVLVHLCPRVQYISIGRSERSLDATVHYLLSEINGATLRLFSLCVRRACSNWMAYWKNQIESEGVFNDYSIKVIDKNFYLWWND
ncbi:unnamed protein product [Adineta ricciae]|uniref:F-box domain-containing protein n=1 Tax=Adineta ricciae TaxID=249248 RepID=A0A815PTQ2_ADIRI|nr:unnamed protein product [Adineta ricciae]